MPLSPLKNHTAVSCNRTRFSIVRTGEWCDKDHLIVINLFEKLLIFESTEFHDCPHKAPPVDQNLTEVSLIFSPSWDTSRYFSVVFLRSAS